MLDQFLIIRYKYWYKSREIKMRAKTHPWIRSSLQLLVVFSCLNCFFEGNVLRMHTQNKILSPVLYESHHFSVRTFGLREEYCSKRRYTFYSCSCCLPTWMQHGGQTHCACSDVWREICCRRVVQCVLIEQIYRYFAHFRENYLLFCYKNEIWHKYSHARKC